MQEFGHGGNLWKLARTTGRSMRELLDFSANINPLGTPEWLSSLIKAEVGSLVHYPDPNASSLIEATVARYGVPPEGVLIGNRSAELIYTIPRALAVEAGDYRNKEKIFRIKDPTKAYTISAARVAKSTTKPENFQSGRILANGATSGAVTL